MTTLLRSLLLLLLLSPAALAELPAWFNEKSVAWVVENLGRDVRVGDSRFLCWYQDEDGNGLIEGWAGLKFPRNSKVDSIGLLSGDPWDTPQDDGACLENQGCHIAPKWEPVPVTLRWKAPPDDDLAYYTVYEDGFPTYKVTETAVKVERIPGACYMVTAVDTSGNESLPSNEACEGA